MDLGTLYEKFEHPLMCIALKLVRNAEEAEELVQDSFLKALSNASLFENLKVQQQRKWLIQTLKNSAIDRARSRQRSLDFIRDALVADTEDYSGHDLADQIFAKKILEHIPTADRTLVEMNLYDDMTTKQIALEMDMPHATVRSRLHLAFKKLKNTKW